jgi:hypothetical protein
MKKTPDGEASEMAKEFKNLDFKRLPTSHLLLEDTDDVTAIEQRDRSRSEVGPSEESVQPA